MASEKADLPQDTDSLPPNYASSEVFTDSPPPAYRKTNTVRLQITRVVCVTVLLAGFLTGTFILAHTWITGRNMPCDCGVAPNLPVQSASLLQAPQSTSSFKDALPEGATDHEILDGNRLEDNLSLDQESRQMDIPLPLDESSDEEKDAPESPQEAAEDEQDSLQSLVEEQDKKIKLPIDLLFGNPALAGKDVQCKVGKKMQNLGGGILSKTIIVTCEDENEEDKPVNPFEALIGGSSRPYPSAPMSLLAPILKMMAARANGRLQRQMQPNPQLRMIPQPFLQPIGISINRPFPQPFPMPFSRAFDGPAAQPMMASMSVHEGNGLGQMSHFHNGPMPMPGNSIMPPNFGNNGFFPREPSNEQHLFGRISRFDENENESYDDANNDMSNDYQDSPFRGDTNEVNQMPEEGPHPFMPEPIFRPFPLRENEPEIPSENQNPPNVKIVRGFPPQIPDAIKQIVSHIMRNSNKDNSDRVPVIAIKAVPEVRSMDSDSTPPKSKLLPFPFRAIKLQGRGGRQLDLNGNNETPVSSAPFPLPRGALSSGMRLHEVPDATSRALDSPVTIPSHQELPPLRFFPGRLLRLPVPLPEGRAITHMEMKQDEISQLPLEDTTNQDTLVTSGPDFGPPRRHTVLRGPLPTLPVQDNIPQESSPLTPFLQRFPAPPPPQFARDGRVGIVKEENPDAELVNPAESREHHMVMVN